MAEVAYQHEEAPRSVAAHRGTKSKYRPPPQEEQFGNSLVAPANIMFDRRVVRGNTYAAQIIPPVRAPGHVQRESKASFSPPRASPPSPEPDLSSPPCARAWLGAQAMQAEMQTRMALGKPVKKAKKPAMSDMPREDVPPVDNRKHMDIQTEAYLEELTDRVVEADMDTQTDAFLDRPAAPMFVPMKTGLDAETQIYEGDLFDFDVEVDPILEVLVGKTLEQSMLEVMEEEELAAMKEHQDHFEQIRNVELAETQRMEEAEKRRFEEKERRMAQEEARVQRERQVAEKVAAHTFTKGYLQGLHSAVFQNLHESGFFYNPLEREVTTEFLPWLMADVQERVARIETARALADDLIGAVVARQQVLLDEAAAMRATVDGQHAAAQKEAAEKAAAEAAAAAAAAAGVRRRAPSPRARPRCQPRVSSHPARPCPRRCVCLRAQKQRPHLMSQRSRLARRRSCSSRRDQCRGTAALGACRRAMGPLRRPTRLSGKTRSSYSQAGCAAICDSLFTLTWHLPRRCPLPACPVTRWALGALGRSPEADSVRRPSDPVVV